MINTEKLELPSISQVQTRGPVDSPWFSSNYSRPKHPGDRLPDLHLPQSYASTTARVGGPEPLSTAHGIQYSTAHAGSYSDNNTGIGLKTPSPSPTSLCSAPPIHGLPDDPDGRSDFAQSNHYNQSTGPYPSAMNQQHQYLESQQAQMSGGQPYAPHSTTASGMTQYSSYPQQQPPPLQPGPGNYAQSPSYGQYGYPNSITSPSGPGHPVSSSMSGQMNSGLLPLPAMGAGGAAQHTYVGAPTGPPPNYPPQNPDTSGQVAPSGMKPRVTATLWEDEGCMCFQVEAKGVCVARRDDNHMINGTKLLNVAGMTRGRRDGILKSEKTRHVVKIGPMHLKGVWIPFDRALDFANKEKITESLYPLFVHNIGALLYHPTNQSRTNAVMAAADRRRLETSKQQGGGVGHPGSQPPSLHHHHSMNSSINTQQPHSIAPHPGAGRPGLDRAHTFPTPPTSASSTSIGLSNQGSYGWEGQSIPGSAQPLMLDSHPHSTPATPATPATTPPGGSMPTLQPYQSHQSYDNTRPMYSSAAPQQGQYATQHQQTGMSHGPPLTSNSYGKQDMGPPATRAPGSKTESEHGDSKADIYGHGQGNDRVGHEEAEHDQEGEYAHDAAYAPHRGPYNHYNSASHMGPLHGEHAQAPSEINGSQPHQNGSGRSTPRTSNGSQQPWPAAGYHTPPRAAPSSNLYNPMSDTRGTVTNGNNGAEHYATAPLHPYAPTQSNGVNSSNKRMREDEEYTSRPQSRNDDIDSMKRRKMGREGSGAGKIASSSYESDVKPVSANRPRTIATPRAHR